MICKFLCSTTIISSYSNSASPVNFELLVPLARSLSNTPTTVLVPRSSHLTHPLAYHALSTRRPGGCQLHRTYPNRQARPLAACNIDNEENQDEYTNADTCGVYIGSGPGRVLFHRTRPANVLRCDGLPGAHVTVAQFPHICAHVRMRQ